MKSSKPSIAATFAALSLLGCATFSATNLSSAPPSGRLSGKILLPTTHQDSDSSEDPSAASIMSLRRDLLYYHGGPVLDTVQTAPATAYYLWYGSWGQTGATSTGVPSDGQQTVTELPDEILESTGTSAAPNDPGQSYFDINTDYYSISSNGTHNEIANTTAIWNKGYYDNYSQGTSLSDAAVQQVVTTALDSGQVPIDPDGVYFVLTSSNVSETSGFCTQYCAWHDDYTYSSTTGADYDIKYAFIGNTDACPSACEIQTTSPHDDTGLDGMANTAAHEFEEGVTDPDLDAWYSRSGNENADNCVWNFGSSSTAANGSSYNQQWDVPGTTTPDQWMIQQNWNQYTLNGHLEGACSQGLSLTSSTASQGSGALQPNPTPTPAPTPTPTPTPRRRRRR